MKSDVKYYSIFKLACPIFFQMLLSMCLGYIDTIMVSQYSETAVGALGNAGQIFTFLSVAFTVIASATGIVVAQFLGAKQLKEINKIYTVAFTFNFVLSFIISVFIVLFSSNILKLINVPDVMMADAKSYMKIVGCFIFADAIIMVFSQIFNCNGKTKIGMFVFLGINVLNAIGNYLFLFGPLSYLGLGVKGVAIATSSSRIIGIIISFILFKKIIKGSVSLKYLFPFPREIFIKLIKIGVPTAGENFSYNISQIIITSFVNTLGPEAITAKICCNSLMLFSLIYSNSMAGATAIVTGHSVGAGDYDFAYKRVLKSLYSAIIVSVIVATLNYVLSKWTVPFFSDNPKIIEIGRQIMFVGIFLEMGRCVNLVIIQNMRAAGDVVFSTILGVCSMWGISVVFAWILGIKCGLGLKGVWIAMALDEIFRAIVVIIRWKLGFWKNKSVVSKSTGESV